MNERSKDSYKVVKSERKYNGHVLNVRIDHVMFPNNATYVREVIEHTGAVGIVPLCKDGSVILVKQYRHAIEDFILEIPAGLFHQDESPPDCAVRELREETGAVSEELIELAQFYTTPGYSTERFYLYLAVVGEERQPLPEDDEFLQIIKISLDRAIQMVHEKKIEDAKTIIGLCLASMHANKCLREQ